MRQKKVIVFCMGMLFLTACGGTDSGGQATGSRGPLFEGPLTSLSEKPPAVSTRRGVDSVLQLSLFGGTPSLGNTSSQALSKSALVAEEFPRIIKQMKTTNAGDEREFTCSEATSSRLNCTGTVRSRLGGSLSFELSFQFSENVRSGFISTNYQDFMRKDFCGSTLSVTGQVTCHHEFSSSKDDSGTTSRIAFACDTASNPAKVIKLVIDNEPHVVGYDIRIEEIIRGVDFDDSPRTDNLEGIVSIDGNLYAYEDLVKLDSAAGLCRK